MGINGDIQHKLMSLHISSIETLNKPAHIFVYFFLFVDWLVWGEKIEMQKEVRIMPRKDKPNVYLVLMTTGFICLLMMWKVERGADAIRSCLVLLKPTHMVIVQLIYVIQGLEKKNYQLVTWFRRKKDKCKLSYNNMQTNSVCQKNLFDFFLFILFVNNKPLKYRK